MPDSRAFMCFQERDGVGNIWRQPLDGNPSQQFTHFTEGNIGNFALSADGHQLALAHGRHFNDVVLITDFR